jgi:hypothetical protein
MSYYPKMVPDRWDRIAAWYEEIPDGHTYQPMRDLVRGVVRADTKQLVSVGTSHRDLWVTTSDRWEDTYYAPLIGVGYRPDLKRFCVTCQRVRGVPVERKWCDLAEAQATMVYWFKRLDTVA